MFGEDGGTQTPTLQVRNLRCYSVTPRPHAAESSGLEPQLFIHLFSKQRQFPNWFTLHRLVGRAGVAPATQEAAVLQTVAHADRRADLC